MFIRTQDDVLVNLNNVFKCEIRPYIRDSDYSVLVAVMRLQDVILYTSSTDNVKSAMNTLVEGIARGATLISYYKDDCNDSMCGN